MAGMVKRKELTSHRSAPPPHALPSYVGSKVEIKIGVLEFTGVIKKVFYNQGAFLVKLSEGGGYMTVHPEKVEVFDALR